MAEEGGILGQCANQDSDIPTPLVAIAMTYFSAGSGGLVCWGSCAAPSHAWFVAQCWLCWLCGRVLDAAETLRYRRHRFYTLASVASRFCVPNQGTACTAETLTQGHREELIKKGRIRSEATKEFPFVSLWAFVILIFLRHVGIACQTYFCHLTCIYTHTLNHTGALMHTCVQTQTHT